MEATSTPFADWVTTTGRGLGYQTDAQLAAAIGVQQSTVTRWRSGSQPSIKHLVSLAEVFGMKISPLLAMSGHVPPELLNEAEAPTPPVTETVRRIQESPLSERQKAHLFDYWSRRLADERERLWQIMELIEEAEGTDKRTVGDRLQQALLTLTHSNITSHVVTLLSNLFALEASPRRRSAGKGRLGQTVKG
ncbi:helix-turn-helix domain-containing protein [Streptosporangium minutum]|uniref:helix-turn-helix domain-containing protein n=1 Tax=Streptosporangium minutum TaxID=569862 RepID=UPI0013FE3C94|nr:helix-turn-helix domain-containing protein [Streptosporangium minutum]